MNAKFIYFSKEWLYIVEEVLPCSVIPLKVDESVKEGDLSILVT